MYVYLILSNIGNKPLFQWRQYASQLLKTGCASYAKGLRSRQRSTGPFADRSLCLLCALNAETVNQPGFYVERSMQIDARTPEAKSMLCINVELWRWSVG